MHKNRLLVYHDLLHEMSLASAGCRMALLRGLMTISPISSSTLNKVSLSPMSLTPVPEAELPGYLAHLVRSSASPERRMLQKNCVCLLDFCSVLSLTGSSPTYPVLTTQAGKEPQFCSTTDWLWAVREALTLNLRYLILFQYWGSPYISKVHCLHTKLKCLQIKYVCDNIFWALLS